MFTCLAPGHIGLRGMPIEASVGLASGAGFEGLGFDIVELAQLAEARGAEYARDLFARSGLRPGQWNLPVAYRNDERWQSDLAELPRLAALARSIGADRATTGVGHSSDERDYAANWDWHLARLRPIAEVLRDNGIRLGIEFIGPKTSRAARKHEFIYTLEGVLDLSRALGTGNVGALLDAWHLYTSGGSIDDLDRVTNQDVVVVHVNDAPVGIARDEQMDLVRALPMATGVIDLPGFMGKLKKMGYDGPVMPEPFSKELNEVAATDPLAAAKIAAESMRRVWKLLD